MTTRTTLSDEGMVQRRNPHHTASDSASLSVYFLIANARLEFSVNHRKDSPLKISNRERIAIFQPRSHVKLHGRGARGANMPLACPEEDHRRRRAPEFLIATFEQSENQSSSSKQRTKQNSNSNKNGISANYARRIVFRSAGILPALLGFLTGTLLVAPNNFAGSRATCRGRRCPHRRIMVIKG